MRQDPSQPRQHPINAGSQRISGIGDYYDIVVLYSHRQRTLSPLLHHLIEALKGAQSRFGQELLHEVWVETPFRKTLIMYPPQPWYC